ncbi:MAG: tetratricopeptide repeat protein, partial [Planctomycetota bacterium]
TLAALAAVASEPAERERLAERAARAAEARALRWPSGPAFTQLIALTLAMPEGPSGALLSETPPPDPSARAGATEREKTLYDLRAKLDALPEAEGIRQSFLALQLAGSEPGRASDPAFARAVAERYEKAVAAYESRSLEPPLLVLNNLAWYLSESGDGAMRARAVEIAERARKLVPRLQLGFDVHDTYAWALYRAGKFAEARAALERVLAEAPRLRPEQAALVHYRLGRVFQGLRDYDAALEHVQQALSSGARFAEESAARELERELAEERRKIFGGG